MSSVGAGRRNWGAVLLVLLFLAVLFCTVLTLLTTYWTTPKPFLQGLDKTTSASPTAADPSTTSGRPDKQYFEQDLLDFRIPDYDVDELSKYPPHNYQGPGYPAFGTFFITRDGTLHDPLFISAQQLVYRLLWAEDKKSDRYPVVVFVLPFVPELQRTYFRAAGAIVREIEVREFDSQTIVLSRYRDQFAKLNMWRNTDFSRLLYMDADALPWSNIDSIFDEPPQRCNQDLLSTDDARNIASICDYTFAAWVNSDDDQINAGVMLLQPNHNMYERLVREFHARDGDFGPSNEQGFLNKTFDPLGPFPRSELGDKWNGGHEEGSDFYILHGKPWVLDDKFAGGGLAWVGAEFNETWHNLTSFYESEEFTKLRIADRDEAAKKGS